MPEASTTEAAFRVGLLRADGAIPEGVTDGAGRPAGRRYDVYRNNVAVALREALETGFPAVAKLIGPENFARAAGLYLRRDPPETPLMMQYGASFAAFLEQIDALRGIGYLGDVARLELAMRRSYHAADAVPFDAGRLAALEDSTLRAARLILAPSVQVVRSPWPVLSVYRYTMLPDQPKPQARAEDVLITRPEFDPAPHLLPQGGAAFIDALRRGLTFGAALTAAGADFDLPATLTLLLQQGAISDLQTA
ncbi:DNA-binding domain-containing protein [Antarctobacter heliothermus]|uniref:Putative DNA-binding domain-containing protein n=1 Tax=Antarctobacter heliothermus TaxID=74033 RepID=A0A239HEC2_9RHOB|nr:DNA-binding domain-containing protein [Antarctobacter heliothermus]SNS78604.1 Putative DNA-binding domain-containing protein [Antarctobacter heliothermus]